MNLRAQGWTTTPNKPVLHARSRGCALGQSASVGSLHRSVASTAVPTRALRSIASITIGDKDRGGRYSKHFGHVHAKAQARAELPVKQDTTPTDESAYRSLAESCTTERLCIPKNRGNVGRIMSDVFLPYGRYYSLPELPKTPSANPEKQKEACDRLSRILPPFNGGQSPSPPSSDMPTVSATEQQAYMNKLAVPMKPMTPLAVKRQQKEQFEQRERERRLAQVREWQARQRVKLTVGEPVETAPKSRVAAKYGVYAPKRDPVSIVVDTEPTTRCDTARSNVANDEPVIQWGGNWESVLIGLETLAGKLDDQRIPIKKEQQPTVLEKAKRPTSAPNSVAAHASELAPIMDELLWILTFALQGARALKSRERLEQLLLTDVVPTLRRAGCIPVAHATMKRFEGGSSRLARILMSSKGGACVPAEDLKIELETCRDNLLRKEYITSAFDFTLENQKY